MSTVPVPQSPLMETVIWQGQEYFTSQYFHKQYLANSQHGAKYQRHTHFVRLLRTIPAYNLYLAQGDIVELQWGRIKTEGNQVLDSFQPLFQAGGWNPITLLNATAQVAMSHHLDDELSKHLSVAANTTIARQVAKKGTLLPDEIAARQLAAWQEMGRLLGTPPHIVQQEAAKQIESTTGINLRPLLIAAPAQNNILPEEKMLEPRDLAKALGVSSAQTLNRTLEHLGWQVKRIGGGWEATPQGKPYASEHAWIANHGAKTGYNLKWQEAAIRHLFRQHGILPTEGA